MEESKDTSENLQSDKKLPLEAIQLQPSTSELEALDKVRSILFGKQLEEQQTRIGQVGSQLTAEIANLRQLFTNHMNVLESEFVTEIQVLRATVTQNKTEQTETEDQFRESLQAVNERLDSVANEMKEHVDSLKSGLGALQERGDRSAQHLREHLDRVDQLIEELRNSKVEYTQLAGLFGDAAARLQQPRQSG